MRQLTAACPLSAREPANTVPAPSSSLVGGASTLHRACVSVWRTGTHASHCQSTRRTNQKHSSHSRPTCIIFKYTLSEGRQRQGTVYVFFHSRCCQAHTSTTSGTRTLDACEIIVNTELHIAGGRERYYCTISDLMATRKALKRNSTTCQQSAFVERKGAVALRKCAQFRLLFIMRDCGCTK